MTDLFGNTIVAPAETKAKAKAFPKKIAVPKPAPAAPVPVVDLATPEQVRNKYQSLAQERKQADRDARLLLYQKLTPDELQLKREVRIKLIKECAEGSGLLIQYLFIEQLQELDDFIASTQSNQGQAARTNPQPLAIPR